MCIKQLIASLCLLLSASVYSACDQPLVITFGVTPWASAQINHVWASRVNKHLIQHCIKGRFSSAKNFHEFINKIINKQFDVVNVPPNIGSYLISEHKMPAIALEDWKAEVLIIADSKSQIYSLADLNHHKIALPDSLSMVSMIAMPLILPHSQAANIKFFSHHNAVFKSVLDGDSQVGAVISPIYNGLKSTLQKRVRIIHKEYKNLPGLLINSNGLSQSKSDRLFNALSTFDSGNSKIWQRWLPPSEKSLNNLRQEQSIYIDQIIRFLHENKKI